MEEFKKLLCFLFYLKASLPETITISSAKKITLEKNVNFYNFLQF
jgi:hypothetical protein